MSKLGAKWQSYSDCLKVNSAITFQTPVEEEFNIYTLAHAKNAGWMFRIPVWDRYGNGYIYDSNFITKEQAAQEGHSAVTEFQEQIDESKEHAEAFRKVLALAEKRFAALAKVEERHATAYQRMLQEVQ